MQQLSWLVEKSTGNAPDAYLKQLQQKILECDRKGATNASIPLSETLRPACYTAGNTLIECRCAAHISQAGLIQTQWDACCCQQTRPSMPCGCWR